MNSSTPHVSMDDYNTDWTNPGHRRRYKIPKCYDNIVGKPLTDKRIAYYQIHGWYSEEQKKARKERAEKVSKKWKNWEHNSEGRLIYNPW